jgi:Rrf2 family transcriptional repressor of oqxAB
MGSGRFAMAVHALALLAQSDEGFPSAMIAGSVNTNAVFLRRVLGRLAAVGLIEAREGRGGGYRLARPASDISLAEVYEAMEPEGPLTGSPAIPSVLCPVGAGMSEAFGIAASRARDGLVKVLARQSVAEVASTALARGKLRHRRPD